MRDLSKPTVPSDAIQRRFAEETQARKAAAGSAASLADGEGSPAELREALAAAVEGLAGEIVALSHAVHDNPEVGYEERFAVSAVADLLRGWPRPRTAYVGLLLVREDRACQGGGDGMTLRTLWGGPRVPGVGRRLHRELLDLARS